MNRVKEWLMKRYCPLYLENMPEKNTPGLYRVDVIVGYGYWMNQSKVVRSELVYGFQNAYKRVRWMALVYDFTHPEMLYRVDINYGVKAVEVPPHDIQ